MVNGLAFTIESWMFNMEVCLVSIHVIETQWAMHGWNANWL